MGQVLCLKVQPAWGGFWVLGLWRATHLTSRLRRLWAQEKSAQVSIYLVPPLAHILLSQMTDTQLTLKYSWTKFGNLDLQKKPITFYMSGYLHRLQSKCLPSCNTEQRSAYLRIFFNNPRNVDVSYVPFLGSGGALVLDSACMDLYIFALSFAFFRPLDSLFLQTEFKSSWLDTWLWRIWQKPVLTIGLIRRH